MSGHTQSDGEEARRDKGTALRERYEHNRKLYLERRGQPYRNGARVHEKQGVAAC